MVLLLKGVGDYNGIGLVEVVWKAVTVILNSCFAASIAYQDSLHGFRSDCGTGTSPLEVKLLQKVTAMTEEFLHTIFLELHKVYDNLEMSMCTDILEGYGVGTRDLFLLRRYWERIHMV